MRNACVPSPSPPPASSPPQFSDEVIWANLPMRENQRVVRKLAMGVAFVALLILYLPVTAAIQVGWWWCVAAWGGGWGRTSLVYM